MMQEKILSIKLWVTLMYLSLLVATGVATWWGQSYAYRDLLCIGVSCTILVISFSFAIFCHIRTIDKLKELAKDLPEKP